MWSYVVNMSIEKRGPERKKREEKREYIKKKVLLS